MKNANLILINILANLFLLISFFIFPSNYLLAKDVDYAAIKAKYPTAKYVILDKKVKISYFVDAKTQQVRAKSLHTFSVLTLEDDATEIDLIQVPFSAFEEVNILSAKYARLDSLDSKLVVETVKVKYVEVKDYFLQNILYADIKVKQFKPHVPIKSKMTLDYSYEIIYKDLLFLNRFYAQDSGDNVENFELTIEIPSFVKADIRTFNIAKEKLNVSKESKNNSQVMSYKLRDLTTTLLPKTTPANYYLPHFVVSTQSVQQQGTTKNILTSTDDLYAWYNSLVLQLQPDKAYLNDLASKIVVGKTTPEEKIEAIFKWVQHNIAYIAFEDGIAGFKPEEAQKVAQLKYGDCKGMANLLVELLRSQGFSAYHTWIGTRSLNYDYSLPSLIVDNHMICAVNFQDKFYFLDGTDQHIQWKYAPSHIQGKQALVGIDNSYKILTVPIDEATSNKTTITTTASLDKGVLQVIGTIVTTGETYNEIIATKKRLGVIKQNLLEKKVVNYLLNDVKIEEATVIEDAPLMNSLKMNFKASSANQVLETVNKTFIFCDLDRVFYKEYVEDSTAIRFFDTKKQHSTSLQLTIPAKTKAILPANLTVEASKGAFKATIRYEIKQNVIYYSKEILINTLLLESSAITEWNEFVQKLTQSYATPIIFIAN
jgi:transglutaminase-like putative cysteine protease